jgi:hypothetical protein
MVREHGMISKGGKDDFTARLARIHAGTGHTKATLFMGLDETVNVPLGKLLVRPKTEEVTHDGTGWLGLSVALVLGAAATIAAMLVQYHVLGKPAPDVPQDMVLAIRIVMALAIGYGLGLVLRLVSFEALMAQALGVLAVVTLLHNAVHLAPEPFAKAFSSSWVQEIMASTEFRTAVFRGEQLTF